ncbi:MAG: YidC/Oxa1 family membrane protein insertase [Thermoleophilia bacterium]
MLRAGEREGGLPVTSILQPLIDVLFAILETVHDNLSLSWGWSIVILTVIVRLAMLPLTIKQMKSMRAMQVLQPQIKALQDKYKHDRELLNQKMMEFYRENKFNPFGSCLPLLLQMPIFISLFYMLRQEADRGVFNVDNQWLWIRDWGIESQWIAETITQFDLPLLLLYVASQFLASAMMVTRDSSQKMMMYAMPVGIGVVMFIGRWPAGLFIYWFTSNLWTIAQQYVINRTLPHPGAIEPKGKTRPAKEKSEPVSSGGKSGSRKRSKKKKGGKR